MNYKLTKEADNDLLNLYLYGYKIFGEAQADKYYFELEECIKLLCKSPFMCRERKEFSPAVRIHHHKRHLIIYLIQMDHILIVRVLHDSMDIKSHLKDPE